MICSLTLGRKGSVGFPGKNKVLLRGKPLAEHVFNEVKKCSTVTRHFLSTDDEKLSEIARPHGFEIIARPPFWPLLRLWERTLTNMVMNK